MSLRSNFLVHQPVRNSAGQLCPAFCRLAGGSASASYRLMPAVAQTGGARYQGGVRDLSRH